MKTKKCSKCNKKKTLDNFTVDRRNKDGLRCQCRLCNSLYDQSVKHTPRRRFVRYKKGAKERKLFFDITFEKFKEITKMRCIYCNEYTDSNDEIFCGLDRINSDIGYIEENIVPCCSKCNYMKGSLSAQEFKNHVAKIYKNQNKKENK